MLVCVLFVLGFAIVGFVFGLNCCVVVLCNCVVSGYLSVLLFSLVAGMWFGLIYCVLLGGSDDMMVLV